MSNRTIDWEKIYRDYITGIDKDGVVEFPTLKDLSEKYHVALITVLKHSAKEKWPEARKQFLRERHQKSQQKIVEEFAKHSSNFDSVLLDKAKKIVDKLDAIIENPKYASRYLAVANMLRQLEELKKEILGEDNNNTSEDSLKDFLMRLVNGSGDSD
jgi:ribosomal protein S25